MDINKAIKAMDRRYDCADRYGKSLWKTIRKALEEADEHSHNNDMSAICSDKTSCDGCIHTDGKPANGGACDECARMYPDNYQSTFSQR